MPRAGQCVFVDRHTHDDGVRADQRCAIRGRSCGLLGSKYVRGPVGAGVQLVLNGGPEEGVHLIGEVVGYTQWEGARDAANFDAVGQVQVGECHQRERLPLRNVPQAPARFCSRLEVGSVLAVGKLFEA